MNSGYWNLLLCQNNSKTQFDLGDVSIFRSMGVLNTCWKKDFMVETIFETTYIHKQNPNVKSR